MRLDLSGKAKTIELPNEAFIFTSPGLDVTITIRDNGEQATFNITGSFHQTTNPENGEVTTFLGVGISSSTPRRALT
jgi:hypothetical protein